MVWYRTIPLPNEKRNNDGERTHYPDRAKCDPDLYKALQKIIQDNNRNVEAIRKAGVLPTTTFYEALLTLDMIPRQAWLEEASNCIQDCDVLFLDPDNGLQVQSVSPGSMKAPKYVFWDDFSFYEPERSLIIYQHRWQKTSYEKLAKQQVDQLHAMFKSRDIYALSYSPDRIFYVIPAQKDSLLSEKVESFLNDNCWKQYFALVTSKTERPH